MRRVQRDVNQKPFLLTQQKILDSLAELVQTGDTSKIKESYYQAPYVDTEGKQQMQMRDELNNFYHGKCAYCETDCKAEIEHYRPKKSVRDVPVHPGYYWLCYEWSNLLPSCHDCNTAGGKGTQFPVAGTRLNSPVLLPNGSLDPAGVLSTGTFLQLEQPFLLHPEQDDPDQYLKVELDPKGEGIKLSGIDGQNQRGEQTIRITNLNRTSLKVNRLRTLSGLLKGIKTIFGLLAERVIELENIETGLSLIFQQVDQDAADEHQQHTIVLRQAVASSGQFAKVVLPLLDPEIQSAVQAAFTKYRLNNPV